MGAVGLFDAKTHFSEYVARAEAGEEIIITRHNKPVAKIVPYGPAAETVRERHLSAVDALLKLRKRYKLGSVTPVQLIAEGRKH